MEFWRIIETRQNLWAETFFKVPFTARILLNKFLRKLEDEHIELNLTFCLTTDIYILETGLEKKYARMLM